MGTEFYPFFLAIFAGVFFSMISRQIHVPWVVALILGGVLFGPSGFGILEPNQTMSFLGEIGLVFLMFMAGLEVQTSTLRNFRGRLSVMPLLSGFIPFCVGAGIAYAFGYPHITAVVLGIVFVSSSVAVVIPTLSQRNQLGTAIGQSTVASMVILDVVSLAAISIILQNADRTAEVPLYIFYPIVIAVLLGLRYAVPRLRKFFVKQVDGSPDHFQLEFRSTFLILIGTVILFELFGLHPIVAGFFSGLVLSGSISSDVLKEKIQTISYGIFIPVFFVLIGLRTDISVIAETPGVFLIVCAVILGLILSKLFSGWLGAKIAGFGHTESMFYASSSLPQLSTTLATAFTALSFGLIDEVLMTTLITLSVVTVVVSPVRMNQYVKHLP